MVDGLSVSDLINVSVTLTPIATGARNFGIGLIAGSSSVIDVNERLRFYTGITGVQQDFPINSPELLAATSYFAQNPQPVALYVGRWAQTATSGILHGAILTPTQQLISNFQPVTSGAFEVTVDGVPIALTGLNFSGAANLNAVAFIVQTALGSAARCIWGSVNKRFDIISNSTGALSSVSYAKAPSAVGSIAFTAQPAAGSTITLNGTAITFVTAITTGNQVLIGASLAATLASLITFINTNPNADAQIAKFTPTLSGNILELVAVTPGSGGNSLTIATTVTGATASGPTLSGGTGTDVSGLLGLVAPGASLVNGIVAESALSCAAALTNASNQWYGMTFAAATPPSDADYQSVGVFLEAQPTSRIFGVTIISTTVLDPTRSDDLGSVLQSLGLARTFSQFSSGNPYVAASILGRISTVDFTGSLTTITLMYKQEPGTIAEKLTESQAAALKAKSVNVFALYQNQTAIVQFGTMANGAFIDERQGLDWLQNSIQVGVYNLLYTAPTKIPQTNDGMNQIANRIAVSLKQGVVNGLLAPGVWNFPGFGTLAQGDRLEDGYYIFTPNVDNQSQADREARKSVSFQVAAKGAGAVHTVLISVEYNR